MQKKVRKKKQIAPVYCDLCGQSMRKGFLWVDKEAGKVWVVCEKCSSGGRRVEGGG